MADLATIVEQLNEAGVPDMVARNTAAQFGRGARQYLGATILPEVNVPRREYKEEAIRFRTVIAPDGDRYSAAQRRGADLYASFLVETGSSDIAVQLDGSDYDALVSFLNSNQDISAIAAITSFLDEKINHALLQAMERQRWEAIVDAQVERRGDNNYSETVVYANPAGHRVTPAAPWSTVTTDIYNDIFTLAQLLWNKGYQIGRIITSRNIVSIMATNDTVKARGGITVVNATGQIQGAAGRATLANINQVLSDDGLPPIEMYDQRYSTQLGTFPYLKNDAMVFIATTDRDVELDLGDNVDLFPLVQRGSQLGYHAVAPPSGYATPQRIIKMNPMLDNKPPSIDTEGWVEHLSVIQEPEAVACYIGIT